MIVISVGKFGVGLDFTAIPIQVGNDHNRSNHAPDNSELNPFRKRDSGGAGGDDHGKRIYG